MAGGRHGRIRVLVAEDHPIYRYGVVHAIKERPDLELVAECEDGRSALAGIRDLQPDVALLDLKMPELSGVEILAALDRSDVATRVIILSAYTDSVLVYDAVAAGAAGYLSKDVGRQTICDAIVAIARGETVFSPQIHSALAEQVRVRRSDDRPRLTARETEILRLTANGLTARQIADHLVLSPTTVKTHLQNLYEKLGVSDRAAAVAEAMRQRLLD